MGLFDDLKKEQKQGQETATPSLFADLEQPLARQEAGPIPSKSGLISLLPSKEEVPELLLSAAGMAAKRTLPGMGLSALGAAAGEGIRQAVFEDQPLTPKERTMKLLGAATRGAVGEAGGRFIGKAFTPFAGGITPEIAAGRKTAESIGIEPPLSAITEAKVPQALERFGEVSFFGERVTKIKNAAIKQLEFYADKVGRNISSDKPSEMIGQAAEENIQGFDKVFRATKNNLYDAVIPLVKDMKPKLENTINAIKGALGKRTLPINKAERSYFENIIETLTPQETAVKRAGGRFVPATERIIEEGVPGILQKEVIEETPSRFIGGNLGSLEVPRMKGGGGMLFPEPEATVNTFSGLRELRTALKKKILPLRQVGRTGLAREIEIVTNAISRDLDATASAVSPDIAQGIKEADKFFAIGINKLKDKMIPVLQKVASKEPSKLHKIIFRKDSPELVKAGKEILGEETFNDIKRQWFEGIVENSKSVIEGVEVLSPQKLSNNIRRFGSTIEEAFSDNAAQKEMFDKLVEVSNLMTRGKQITSGSQTAFLGSIINELLSPLRAASVALTSTSPGRELLTRGYPRVGKAVERTVQPSLQLLQQKIFQKRNQENKK